MSPDRSFDVVTPVARDVETARTHLALTPIPRELFESGYPWADLAFNVLTTADGTGRWVVLDRSASLQQTVATLADGVQEVVIEEGFESWPACRCHRGQAPMSASVRNDVAVWVCAYDAPVFAEVGTLAELGAA